MKKRIARERRREQGMALLVATLSLALIGAITLAAINNSGLESTASGRSRSAMRTLHAADAGFRFATKRLSENPANLAAFTLNLGDRNVQSRTRTDATPEKSSASSACSTAWPCGSRSVALGMTRTSTR